LILRGPIFSGDTQTNTRTMNCEYGGMKFKITKCCDKWYDITSKDLSGKDFKCYLTRFSDGKIDLGFSIENTYWFNKDESKKLLIIFKTKLKGII